MKKFAVYISLVLLSLLLASGCFAAEKSLSFNVSGQPVPHSLSAWKPVQDNAFNPFGYTVKYQLFPSGAPQLEALAAGQWSVGAMGTLPSVLSGMRFGALFIGTFSDDSETNDLWVRPDSPLLKVRGADPKFPLIYGSPADWKGKKILCTTMSNGHYMVTATLKALGLTEKDVSIVQMEQGQAIAAFAAGQGDVLQVWAPGSYVAEDKGWKRVSSGGCAGIVIPDGLVVSKAFAESNPEAVANWLASYMQVRDTIAKATPESVALMDSYLNGYCGLTLSKDQITRDFSRRKPFLQKDQVEILTNPEKMKAWLTGVAQFMLNAKLISQKDMDRFLAANCHIEPKFAKMVAERRAKAAQAKQ